MLTGQRLKTTTIDECGGCVEQPPSTENTMGQSKIGSFVESWLNVAIGFSINFTANMIFLPMFGFTTLTASKAFGIGLVFTVISVARSYIIRRWFNGLKFKWNKA